MVFLTSKLLVCKAYVLLLFVGKGFVVGISQVLNAKPDAIPGSG